VLARDGLKVALIGNITPETAGKLLDHVFGGLPAKGELKPVPDITVHGIGQRIVRKIDVPQASVVFGGAGIPRHDPDFVAGYIVNHILGGGSFSSRLYNEVREKRGLAYAVHQSLVWLRHTAFAIGGTATQADRTADAVGIIEREIKRMREEGPTVDELEKAKSFLKGSYALNFDTSTKIIGQLVQLQIDGLGTDYINQRNKLVEAVTIEDAKRAAHRLYDGGILVTVAGPGALSSSMPARAPGG
jgi:zinc protease